MLLCRYWRSVLIDSFATFWLNAPHFFSWWANFSSFYDQVFVFSGDPGSATHQVDAATKETTTEIFSGITGAEVGIDLTIGGGGGGRDRDPGLCFFKLITRRLVPFLFNWPAPVVWG